MINIDQFTIKIPADFTTLVVEGPDSVGKSWIVSNLKNSLSEKLNSSEIEYPRFPDNRDDVGIRDTLFKSQMTTHRAAAPFLFMADFVYWWESTMSSYNENYPKMIWDRGIPSLAVYQNIHPTWIIDALTIQTKLPKFRDFLSKIDYVFLNPIDMDAHFKRIEEKSADDKNAYDPKNYDEVYANIKAYQNIANIIQQIDPIDFPRKSITVINI